MVVFSVLRPSIQRSIGGAALALARKKPQPLLKAAEVVKVMQRNGSGAPKMKVWSTKFEMNVLFDQVHFFIMLGLVPPILLISLANIYIGEAELQDIPEGYEPKEYEYTKYPVQRFLQKYVYESYQREYERNLHLLKAESDRKKLRELEKKIKRLQNERQDYKGWYYLPYNVDRMNMIERERKAQRDQDQ